jgi:hypothetical protein
MSINFLHNKFMNSLNDEHESISKKTKKLETLEKKAKTLDPFDPELYTLESKIYDLTVEIHKIKSRDKYLSYIANVSDILYENNRENINTTKNDEKEGIMKFIDVKISGNGEDLLEQYLSVISETTVNDGHIINDTCEMCNNRMVIIKKESMLSCTCCGHSYWFMDIDTPQWSDSVEINTQFAYDRESHFREHLKQLQGTESKIIPKELLDQIIIEITKMRIHLPDLTKPAILSILKKLKKSQYYNNVNRIMYKLTGNKPPKLPPQLEERLIVLFKTIQKPFEMYKNKERKNFFSYSYVIHKLLLIIARKEPEVSQYVKYFPLLKSRDKLIIQDVIWKRVTFALGWDYDSST